MPNKTEAQTITEIVDLSLNWISDQEYLSQSRCIDVFLDLFQATTDPFVRWSIADRLSEIRFVRIVRGDTMRAALAAIADASAEVGHPETGWCDQLLEAC